MSLYLRLLGGQVSLFATVLISEPPLEPRKLHVAEAEQWSMVEPGWWIKCDLEVMLMLVKLLKLMILYDTHSRFWLCL